MVRQGLGTKPTHLDQLVPFSLSVTPSSHLPFLKRLSQASVTDSICSPTAPSVFSLLNGGACGVHVPWFRQTQRHFGRDLHIGERPVGSLHTADLIHTEPAVGSGSFHTHVVVVLEFPALANFNPQVPLYS